MIPDSDSDPLTSDELGRLLTFLVERGQRDIAVELLDRVAYRAMLDLVAATSA